MKNKKVILAIVLCLALVAGAGVGGTVAWLAASSNEVVNTFTYGDINIKLTESPNTYKIVPGSSITKDPKVTVKGGSEACWLFVEVTESSSPKWPEEAKYSPAAGWKKGTGTTPDNVPVNVYYREVPFNSSDQEFPVLLNNKINVEDTLTKDKISAESPTLKFQAYAIQREGIDSVDTAWAQHTSAVASNDWP